MNTATEASQTFRYEIDNLGSLTIGLDQPVSPMALPQEDASENVLVKMEGNTQSVTVNWKVSNSTATPLSSVNKLETGGIQLDTEEFYYYNGTGNKTYYNSDNDTSPSATWSQHPYTDSGQTVSWLLSEFQGRDLSDRYMLKIPNMGIMEGFVTRINATIDSGSPVVYNLSITFLMGNVISIYETDAPSEPRNLVISSDTPTGASADSIILTWSVPMDSATTISSYGIWVRDEGTSFSGNPDITVSVYSAGVITPTTLQKDTEFVGHVITTSPNYQVAFPDPNFAGRTSGHFLGDGDIAFDTNTFSKIKGKSLVSGQSYFFKIAAANIAGGYGLKSDEKVMQAP
jgi:hypothetical protein